MPRLEEEERPKKRCPLCARELDEWHCRVKCPECGYSEDCSDVCLP